MKDLTINVLSLPRVLTCITAPQGSKDLKRLCLGSRGLKDTVYTTFGGLVQANIAIDAAERHVAVQGSFFDVQDKASIKAVSYRHSRCFCDYASDIQ
jgi:hypothetical protein